MNEKKPPKILRAITIVAGIIFVVCLPAGFFLMHPAVGLLATAVMALVCAKAAIEVSKEIQKP